MPNQTKKKKKHTDALPPVNNLAICFAQHPSLPAIETFQTATNDTTEKPASPTPQTPAKTRQGHLESAQRWALNAYQHASEPQGEQRTPECDSACAVSLCNLADIAQLSGDVAEARRMFEQAIAFSKKIDFPAGLEQAEKGLRKLSVSL
jgi:hypothetical protein